MQHEKMHVMEKELQQVRSSITDVCNRLLDLEKRLQAEDHSRVGDVIEAIQSIRGELRCMGAPAAPPTEKSLQRDSAMRHASEVKSGEYDMQG
jgi:hypothetical protein